MSIFTSILRPSFAPTRQAGAPAPFRGRARRRRMVAMKEAASIAQHLPEDGENVHVILTGRADLMIVLVAILDAVGKPCHHLRLATLSFSENNVAELVHQLGTNAVESLNMSLRKIIKTRGSFPNEEAALRLLYLALRNHSKKWTFVQGWREALNRFQILWPERMPALERN